MAELKKSEEKRASEKPEETVIIKLGGLAERPDALKEIGRRLVIQAIQNAVAERMGQELATPMVVRRVSKGEVVPLDLIGQPKLVVDPGGIASTDWEKSWLNLIFWDREYSKSSADEFLPKLGLTDPLARIRLETILTPEELAVVEKLKIAEWK